MDTADAEIKVPSVVNPELANVLTLKPGVGQNLVVHALSTARNIFLVLDDLFLFPSPFTFIFFQI